MGVGAIAELAIAREMEDVAEITREFFGLDVECAETFDARRIDEIASLGQSEHFAKSGGVHARVVRVADLGRFEVGLR